MDYEAPLHFSEPLEILGAYNGLLESNQKSEKNDIYIFSLSATFQEVVATMLLHMEMQPISVIVQTTVSTKIDAIRISSSYKELQSHTVKFMYRIRR